ncbi:MAG TPA: dihydropteroate synthase [Acidimicrobiia bacterium]
MGIVNVTPDSFSDGGRYLELAAAVAHGRALAAAGADLLDVGGESTRPGAEPVDAGEEIRRVLPVVAALVRESGLPVSIDTRKGSVARAAIDAGAVVVNDVTAGLGDPDMLPIVSDAGAGLVLMHMRGEPRTMQRDPRYDDVVFEVADFLVERIAAAREAGVADHAICADPGIGFGKLPRHNLELLARLPELVTRVEVPVLIGASRKSFIGAVLAAGEQDSSGRPPDSRDDASLATAVWAIDRGARVVRVHDVGPAADAVRLLSVMRAIDAEAVA